MQMRPMEPLGDISSILKPTAKPPKRKGRGTRLNYMHRLELQQHWRESNGLGRNSELYPFTITCTTPQPLLPGHVLCSLLPQEAQFPFQLTGILSSSSGCSPRAAPWAHAHVPAQPLVPPQPRLHPQLCSMPTYFYLMQKAVCPLIGHIFQRALLFWKLWAIKN